MSSSVFEWLNTRISNRIGLGLNRLAMERTRYGFHHLSRGKIYEFCKTSFFERPRYIHLLSYDLGLNRRVYVFARIRTVCITFNYFRPSVVCDSVLRGLAMIIIRSVFAVIRYCTQRDRRSVLISPC